MYFNSNFPSRMFLVRMNLRIFGIEPVARTSSISSSLIYVWYRLTIISCGGAYATTKESTERFVEKCGKVPGFGKMK